MSGHTTFVRSAKLIHVGPVLRRARQSDVGALRDGDTGQSGDACERQPTGARAGCCAQRRQRAPTLRLCARRLYACGHRVWRMAPPSSPRLHGVEEGENRAEAAHIMAPVLELEVRLHAAVHVRRAHGRKRPPPALFPAPAPHPALPTLFQPSIVDEIREILHVPPAGEQPGGAPAPDLGEQAARSRSLQAHGWLHPLKRRGPWRGKARCLSRAARSRSLASRAPRSTTVCACASAPALRRPYSAHVRTARATCAVCTQGRSAGA